MRTYAKAIVAVAIAGLTAAQAAITDGTITGPEWFAIALTTLGAVGVWLVPNKPAPEQTP